MKAPSAFYSELFGWEKLSDHDMGPGWAKYLVYGRGKQTVPEACSRNRREMKMPAAWLYYTQVADLDAAVARANAKGAKVLNGRTEVPGGARIAQLMDPQGAAFALHEESKVKAN